MTNLEDVKQKYIFYAREQCAATISGDYKHGNKCYAKLTEIYYLLSGKKEDSTPFFAEIIEIADPAVQLWAASHCLGLSILVTEAVSKLEALAAKATPPNFEAKMTLKEWRDTGKLSF